MSEEPRPIPPTKKKISIIFGKTHITPKDRKTADEFVYVCEAPF